jgi:hypothetical protein
MLTPSLAVKADRPEAPGPACQVEAMPPSSTYRLATRSAFSNSCFVRFQQIAPRECCVYLSGVASDPLHGTVSARTQTSSSARCCWSFPTSRREVLPQSAALVKELSAQVVSLKAQAARSEREAQLLAAAMLQDDIQGFD